MPETLQQPKLQAASFCLARSAPRHRGSRCSDAISRRSPPFPLLRASASTEFPSSPSCFPALPPRWLAEVAGPVTTARAKRRPRGSLVRPRDAPRRQHQPSGFRPPPAPGPSVDGCRGPARSGWRRQGGLSQPQGSRRRWKDQIPLRSPKRARNVASTGLGAQELRSDGFLPP